MKCFHAVSCERCKSKLARLLHKLWEPSARLALNGRAPLINCGNVGHVPLEKIVRQEIFLLIHSQRSLSLSSLLVKTPGGVSNYAPGLNVTYTDTLKVINRLRSVLLSSLKHTPVQVVMIHGTSGQNGSIVHTLLEDVSLKSYFWPFLFFPRMHVTSSRVRYWSDYPLQIPQFRVALL